MSIVKFSRVLATGLALGLFAATAFAADETSVNTQGVAIHGYDPVSYFVNAQPVRGDESLSAGHDGASYRFSTRKNLREFIKNPKKFAPAYGGWCSYGVRIGKKFDADPNAWVIENGRLFLLLNLGAQKIWDRDRIKNIDIADRLWPKIASIPAKLLAQ